MNRRPTQVMLATSLAAALTACTASKQAATEEARPPAVGESVQQTPRPITQPFGAKGGTMDYMETALLSQQRLQAQRRGPERVGLDVIEGEPEDLRPVALSFKDLAARDALRVIIGDLLGRSYVLDEDVQGAITLEIDEQMSDRDIEDLLEALAVMHGWSVQERGGQLVIRQASDGPRSSVAPILEARAAMPSERPAVRVFRPEHVAPSEVSNAVNPLQSEGGVSVVAGRLLIVADTVRQLNRIGEVVRALDVAPFDGVSIHTYGLRYQPPAAAQDALESLAQVTGLNRADRALASFVAIPGTGRLMVISQDPTVQPIVRRWVEQLDQPPDAPERFNYYYRIQNHEPAELAQLLRDFFADRLERDPTDPTDRGMRIIQSREEDMLLIRATPYDYAEAIAMLRAIDMARQQVYMQAVIAEVVLTNNLRYGVEYFLSGEGGSGVFEIAGGPVTPLGATASTGSAFFLGTDAFAVIEALDTESEVTILSTPSLFARDKAEGSIQVGQEVPIITTRVDTQQGANAIQNEVERRDTGVILEVTPRINEGGDVTLDLRAEITDVQESDPELGPTFSKREITTTVTVPHNQTLLLGGIIREEDTDSVDRVPVLGRIPGVGAAFRSVDRSRQRRELLIAIRPVVINAPADASPLAGEFLASAVAVRSALREVDAGLGDTLIVSSARRELSSALLAPADDAAEPEKMSEPAPQGRPVGAEGPSNSLRRIAQRVPESEDRADEATLAVELFLEGLAAHTASAADG